jgi:hypothetical protein
VAVEHRDGARADDAPDAAMVPAARAGSRELLFDPCRLVRQVKQFGS